MNGNNALERAVADFRRIESALADLAGQTQALAGAGQRLSSAEDALRAVLAQLEEALRTDAELSSQLGSLAGDLANTTEVVRRGDPSKMHQAVERLIADFERQKERISEMAGEIRVRIEQASQSLRASIADYSQAMTTALEEQLAPMAKAISQSRADLMSSLQEDREVLADALRQHHDDTAARIRRMVRHLLLPAVATALLSGAAVLLLILTLLSN